MYIILWIVNFVYYVQKDAVHELKCFLVQLTKTEDSNVYATDAILSTIMCCSRSSNSWDVVVQKIAGKLFFDKRDDSEFG